MMVIGASSVLLQRCNMMKKWFNVSCVNTMDLSGIGYTLGNKGFLEIP
jgi:hypothetical protein